MLRMGYNTVTWVGHASMVVQLDGRTILCDPVWSGHISRVVPRLTAPGLELADVPPPDAVLISHNHYDHLDLPTLRRLGRAVPLYVPAGLRPFFMRRGFENVTELGWWESRMLDQVRLTFVPAQHWSQRFPWDTNMSWWGGWVMEGTRHIYFAGDTAFFSGFAQIAQRFPGIDLALLPIGAYAPPWMMQAVHMNPEEAGAAFQVLGAERMLPIHYGTFRLADEPVGEPIARLQAWWRSGALANERLYVPAIGQTIVMR